MLIWGEPKRTLLFSVFKEVLSSDWSKGYKALSVYLDDEVLCMGFML